MQNDKSVRVSAFVDGGIIGDTYAFSDLRTSAGISVLYVSPFGPLKVSFAQPIKSQEGDKIQKIQFTVRAAVLRRDASCKEKNVKTIV